MKIKTDPAGIWAEYQKGVTYNTQIDLYDNVKRNNDFYHDRQWEGVNAPDLDKPVFNFLKQAVNYYIAMLISDDIAADITLKGGDEEEAEQLEKAVTEEINAIMERENMSFKNRKAIRNAAVDGDCCFYSWFDPDAETDDPYALGQIRTDLIDNTNVIFGNPSEHDPQQQPYILVVYRSLTEEVKEEAEENGQGTDEIVPDSESNYVSDDKNTDTNYTTVILKMWFEKVDGRPIKTVHMVKTTRTAVVKPKWSTGYRRYPVSYMSWESVKNCYHGVAPLTGKIQNQIFVNKLYAMAMIHVMNTGFPKIIYDKGRIPQGWDSSIGKAVAVQGDPNTAIFSNFQPAEMSASVPNLIQSTISQTKDLMGANEAALGNVEPDNTSAIMAVQNQSRVQHDMQRLDFYNCVEGYIRNYVDMMRAHYGERVIYVTEKDPVGQQTKVPAQIDFSVLENYHMNLRVDVGQGSYFSELMQISTLDNLFAKGVIPNAKLYLESLPDGYVKNRQEIIEAIDSMPVNPAGEMVAGDMGEIPPEMMGEIPPEMGQEMEQRGETDELKAIIDELAQLSPEQIMQTIPQLPYQEEDKARIIELLQGRGVL